MLYHTSFLLGKPVEYSHYHGLPGVNKGKHFMAKIGLRTQLFTLSDWLSYRLDRFISAPAVCSELLSHFMQSPVG
jgi:hypothetical protein